MGMRQGPLGTPITTDEDHEEAFDGNTVRLYW